MRRNMDYKLSISLWELVPVDFVATYNLSTITIMLLGTIHSFLRPSDKSRYHQATYVFWKSPSIGGLRLARVNTSDKGLSGYSSRSSIWGQINVPEPLSNVNARPGQVYLNRSLSYYLQLSLLVRITPTLLNPFVKKWQRHCKELNGAE